MTDAPDIVELPLVGLHEATALACGELIALAFPRPNVGPPERAEQLLALGRDYQGPADGAPRSFVVYAGSQVVAHAMALPRTISTQAGPLSIVGLARVATHPSQRGRGLGELVVRRVFALVDNGSFTASLFQTTPQVAPFYQKLGAIAVANRVVNSLADDPQQNPFREAVVMRYPASRAWPEGEIDLLGPSY